MKLDARLHSWRNCTSPHWKQRGRILLSEPSYQATSKLHESKTSSNDQQLHCTSKCHCKNNQENIEITNRNKNQTSGDTHIWEATEPTTPINEAPLILSEQHNNNETKNNNQPDSYIAGVNIPNPDIQNIDTYPQSNNKPNFKSN